MLKINYNVLFQSNIFSSFYNVTSVDFLQYLKTHVDLLAMSTINLS